jgi:hypothetical protein
VAAFFEKCFRGLCQPSGTILRVFPGYQRVWHLFEKFLLVYWQYLKITDPYGRLPITPDHVTEDIR